MERKLLGQEFDNLGQLAQRVAELNSQFQGMRRDTRFQKNIAIAKAYNPYLVDDGYEDDEEEEVAVAKWNWGKEIVMVSNPQGIGVEESYDFNVTKLDKLFNFLLERGQIKLLDNHVMLPPNQLKNKFCKFHNTTSHSTNECRVFRQHIQRAIQQGRPKFDTPQKIKVDNNPFLRDHNMVDARLLKGKTKVLTSTRARETRTVDPVMQISTDEYREIRRHHDQQNSRYELGEMSKDGATRPRVTS